MTEWWQRGEDDRPVPVPRRDQIPEAGFSDPREVTSAPELVTFIPEWRVRRRVIASLVTAFGLVAIASSIYDLFRNMTLPCPVARSQALGQFLFDFVLIAGALAMISLVWNWANRRDPRDLRRSPR